MLRYTTVLHCIALRCVALRCVALRCVALRCGAVRCVALRCVALRCIALHCIPFHNRARLLDAVKVPRRERHRERDARAPDADGHLSLDKLVRPALDSVRYCASFVSDAEARCS